MKQRDIRIGIVGAGQITRTRHVPGFQAIPGVKIVAVCNRRRESAAKFARDFAIPRVYGNWEELIADGDVDAVVIGAWPYLHCPVSLAALEAGKHVLVQARMALNSREAERMRERSIETPELAAMIVPSPYGLVGETYFRSLIESGFLGSLREIHVHSLNDQLADPGVEMSWRQMTRYSGFNMLALGIVYESLLRWVSPAKRVVARASKIVANRFDNELGQSARVGTPDSVQVLTTHEDGGNGVFRLSGVAWKENSMGIALYGSEGTLIYDLLHDEIQGARRKDDGLQPLPIPDDMRGGWRVEADFIAAIRGEREVTHTDFATGVRYMQFTEAVARSSRQQVAVSLPLKEHASS